MNIFRQLIAALTPPMTGRAEREYLQNCKVRQDLDDHQFYNSFYSDAEASLDTCSRVRQVLRTQLNMSNVRPEDNVAMVYDDVEFGEICFAIGDEFQLNFPGDMIESMDGTVDSIVRSTEYLRMASTNHDAGLST